MVSAFFQKKQSFSNGLVYVKFPQRGLGNLLFIWARAYVFSVKNTLPLFVSSWWSIKLGPWIRNENKKRLYFGYFKSSSFLSVIIYFFSSLTFDKKYNPNLDSLVSDSTKKSFLYIRPYRNEISSALFSMLTSSLQQVVSETPTPEIGIHIRRGDFKYGSPITSNEYFINAISAIRNIEGQKLNVTVFTDASDEEIADVLNLSNVKKADDHADIVDIFLLSKSNYLILSQSSSFSYWAAFMSDNIVIRHQNDWQRQIGYYPEKELKFDGVDIQLLQKTLAGIKKSRS
jgi:hypothetical protein